MRIPAIAALLVSLLALPGCIYIPPVWDIDDAFNDLEWIKPNVTTKAQVVERLGEPDSDFGVSIRYTGKRSHGLLASQGGAVLIGERSWYVSIVFDKAGVVRSIDTSEMSETSRLQEELRQKELPALAKQGDVEAQFELYMRGGAVKEEWKWLCRSAHGGHAPAQFATGVNYYKWGWDRKSTDPIQAYLWYSLSAGNGHRFAKSERDALAKTMTPAQIAEAERLVREWKPDLASCGELLVPATDTDVAREDTGVRPSCGAVGGYEAYMKRTGKVCRVAPIIHYAGGPDDQVYPQE